jgi:hypothetical protein
MKRSGFADLPLHGGRVPPWLAQRMEKLGTAIAESIIAHYGVGEFLSRLSNPFWFQALGCVMGMDWHSSGITTSVMGALKRGLNPRARELGVYFCGGRGRQSRKTPAELLSIADERGLDGAALVRTSRLTAKIDNNAIGDGFQIYLHSFAVTAGGDWAVVQQGLNERTGLARRYHWHSASVRDFTSEPHDVRVENVDLKRLGAVLATSYNQQLRDFASLLLVENLGPRTLQTLALIAEVVHGAPSRFSDPARFSFALGGKDRHPFPVPLKTYDESLAILRRALDSAKLGHTEKLDGFKRLDQLVRKVEERHEPTADFDQAIRHEHAISQSLEGRSVFDDRKKPRILRDNTQQLSLFQP